MLLIRQSSDRHWLRRAAEIRKVHRPREFLERVVDGEDNDARAVSRKRGAQVKAGIGGYVGLDLERPAAGARGIKLLSIIRRRLVQTMIVGLNDAGAEAVREVGAVGDVDDVAMPVQEIVGARASQ